MIRRTTWIVLAVFLLALGAALFWQRRQDQQAAEATPAATAEVLVDLAGREVAGLQFSGAAGEELEIEKGLDSSWVVVAPAGNEADQARLEQLIGDLSGLQVTAKLDTTPGLASLGLNPARYRLAVLFEDGNQAVIYIGDRTPIQDGYYAYREGDQVVVVGAFGVDTLLDYLTTPPVLSPPTPATTPEVEISP
jgi:hypothetical protein